MFSSPTAAAGKMTRSRTKAYLVRFSEIVQYFRRLEGTSGRNTLVESGPSTCASTHDLQRLTVPPKIQYGLYTSARERLWLPILSPNICQRAMKGEAPI